MEDFFDFDKLRTHRGLETMTMQTFLDTVASKGLLGLPLPKIDLEVNKQPLWEYLEKSCFQRQWSPGKLYIGFNISMLTEYEDSSDKHINVRESDAFIGDFNHTDPQRMEEFAIKGNNAKQMLCDVFV